MENVAFQGMALVPIGHRSASPHSTATVLIRRHYKTTWCPSIHPVSLTRAPGTAGGRAQPFQHLSTQGLQTSYSEKYLRTLLYPKKLGSW